LGQWTFFRANYFRTNYVGILEHIRPFVGTKLLTCLKILTMLPAEDLPAEMLNVIKTAFKDKGKKSFDILTFEKLNKFEY
jgi:hypothetical protein